MKAIEAMGLFVIKPIRPIKEKIAYRMNNQRIVLLRGVEEKSGATNTAAREEKKPHPNHSKEYITDSAP